MRKALLYIIFITLTTATANAQIGDSRNIFELGFAGGVNFNSMDMQPAVRQSTLQGYNAGVSMRYICEKYFKMICAAQLEINLAQRGWKEDFNDNTSNYYSHELNYVEIPFLAHLAFGKEERGLQFFINLGPQIGFLLSDSEKYVGTWSPEDRPTNARPQYGKAVENKFDYGILGGVGLELRTKIGNFFLEGRYYYGLGDIFKNSKTDDFGRSANNTISARLGYSLRIF